MSGFLIDDDFINQQMGLALAAITRLPQGFKADANHIDPRFAEPLTTILSTVFLFSGLRELEAELLSPRALRNADEAIWHLAYRMRIDEKTPHAVMRGMARTLHIPMPSTADLLNAAKSSKLEPA